MRVAFKMKLFPGYEAEYKRRHAALWPELAALLKTAGVRDYSIFLDEETLLLFAYLIFHYLHMVTIYRPPLQATSYLRHVK